MDTVNIYKYIENPELLTEQTLPEIKQAFCQYPYFQVLRMLYLLNLWRIQSADFNSELEKLAVGVTSREALYILLKGNPVSVVEEKKEQTDGALQNPFALVDAFLATHTDEKETSGDDTSLALETSASVDYLNWNNKTVEDDVRELQEDEIKEEVKFKHQDLIDSFLENETPPRLNLSEDENLNELNTDNEKLDSSLDESDEISLKQIDDSYFTETLARIYIKQKRYDKALQIIKNLNLKYPEKNIYFADQIRFLEKLIINTKK